MSRDNYTPPLICELFMDMFFSEKFLEEVKGDLDELFYENIEKFGIRKAKRLYVADVFFFIRPYLLKKRIRHTKRIIMLGHYMKTFFRNVRREKSYAFLNLIGLTTGIAIFYASVLYTDYELSFDKFHHNSNNLYRIHQKFNDGGETASASYPIGPALVEDYPQIKNMARFNRIWRTRVVANEERFIENDILLVEPALFEIFDFDFVHGSPEVLESPYDIILTDELAEKFFGDKNPIGETIQFPFLPGDHNFVVKGL